MQRSKVYDQIREDRQSHLNRVREFMAQRSISQENVGVQECAEILLRYYRELGCQQAEIVETGGLPAVWAHYDAGAPLTLAVYSYFDTNVVGSGWHCDPFEAKVAEHGPFPAVVYGRGAGNKGAYVGFLNALQAIRTVEGNLPVNLMFVSEGEEFVGSPHIPALIDRYRPYLSRANAVLSPGPSQTPDGDVTLFLGNKGCLHIELECSGQRWGRGPQGKPVHSSAQCVVEHPVWRMVHALATLYDPGEERILVDGFYEGLRGPTAADQALIDALAARYAGREAAAVPGVGSVEAIKGFVSGISGRDVFLRYCFQPTMNINGLRAGYTGPGTTLWTLPHAAYCTIDHRLPPDLDPEICLQKIRAHLDRRGFSDVGIKVLSSMGAQKLSVEDDIAQAALRVFRQRGIEPIVWPRRGASGPTGIFSQMLGLSVLGSTGMGYASGHSTGNEFLVVEGDGRVGGLVELEQSFADLIYSYAAYPSEF